MIDQVLEMAQYIDARRGSTEFAGEIEGLLEKGDKEDILKKIVDASSVISSAPEKEYIPAYNLLIHLVRSSNDLAALLPTILNNLSTPPSTSPINGPALAIHALSTIFNVLPASNSLRYPVFRKTLEVVSKNGMYDVLASQLKYIERWVQEWGSSVEEIRELYIAIADVAEKAKDDR
jgi:translation initiation factor 3 subunit M